MEQTFDSKKYVKSLGEELIYEFDKAGMTTHPHAVGGGREISAKKKLEAVLPAGVGVGSGFVIDSYGRTSKQCDIILYEKEYAMKFIINEDESNAYYNCESVIAVGEVKSVVHKKELDDALAKLSLIKELRRYNPNGHDTRKYLTSQVVTSALHGEVKKYNTDNDPLGQIYTFLLCQKLDVKTDKILSTIKDKCQEEHLSPNRIISTEGAYIGYIKMDVKPMPKLKPNIKDATHIFDLIDNDYSFNHLMSEMLNYIVAAKTVPLNYSVYLNQPILLTDLKKLLKL